MTLAEIIDFTTGKIGITDLTAREEAAKYARIRWGMIWNHAIWRQSRHHDTIAVPAGTEVVLLPAAFDLVHAIRLGVDRMLEPMLDIDALFRDPAGRDQPGVPSTFAVMGKTDEGQVQIRLHRSPTQATSILVLGKVAAPPLVADTDTPLGIPGVDECLCAFVLGDLQQWNRQYSKAEAHFSEAAALLQKSTEIETHQNAETRRLLPGNVQQLEEEFHGGGCW